MSAVTATGTTPPTVTLSGNPTGLVTGQVQIDIVVGGARGTATFRWSEDGGVTWAATQATAASVVLTGSGLTAAFAVGTYNADNLYTADRDVAGSLILLALTGQECANVSMTQGTWAGGGTMYVDVSPDGINWITKSQYKQGGLGGVLDVFTFATTVLNVARVDVAGFSYMRVRGSGTITPSVTPTFIIKAFRGGPIEMVATMAPCSTVTQSSVAEILTNTTLLAANPSRLGCTVYNETVSSNLYLKMGVTASLTSYTVKLTPGAYWELPFRYIGQIDGIWDVADAGGSARITEMTA